MIREDLKDAVAQHQAGRLEQATRLYEKILRIDPDHADALHLLGVIDHQQGRHREAAERIGRAIAVNPNVASYYSNLGVVCRALGEIDRAINHCRHAVAMSKDYAEAHNNLGNALADRGRLDEAEASFRRALEIQPRNVDALNNLGNTLRDLGRLDEAEACCRKTLDINPNYFQALNNLGNILTDQGKSEEAEACYRKVLEVQPDYADALANFAAWFEKNNRAEEAKETAEKCLRAAPDHALANLLVAKCEVREGRCREAIERLVAARQSAESDPRLLKDITFQLGMACDRAGDTATAFDWFTEGNRLAIRELGQHAAETKEGYFQTVEVFSEAFTKEWVDSWSPTPAFDDGEPPVFLVGFPRSGTTLLDVILDSHPRIQTLEEKATVCTMGKEVECVREQFARTIARLTPAMIESMRSTYFREVSRFVDDREGKIVVDKLPLNIVRVGFILRVFPTAKFIVVVRHPCDVCLSCFMQNFKMNAAMSNLFALEDTAELYDRVMRLWRQYVEVLPHAHHLVRYEDLIDDFEGETRRLVEFLGLEWHEGVRQYADHASRNRSINTPSYHQVVEPIYKRAVGRWRRYARQLAPVIDVLRPHIEYFGYDS